MRRALFIPALITGLSLVVLIGLGGWQWQRRADKSALIATIHERIRLAPQPFPDRATWGTLDGAALAYRPVTLTGTFDHSREAHVFFSLSKPVGGVSGPGYLILTPLMLSDGGSVLVNRGFVPAARKTPDTRKDGQSEGTTTVTGLVRLPEARGAFSAADTPDKNVYFVRDPVAIAKGLGLAAVAPLMVDLQAPLPPGGVPVPSVTQVDIPNNHLQYALTWWSLAAALTVIFVVFARRRDS